MAASGTDETEEQATCLHLTVYHPSQEPEKKSFRELSFHVQHRLKACHLVKFGRDCNTCDFILVDSRVSRVQFGLQFFRHFNSSEFGFEIKNLSKRAKLNVDHVELAYLNKVDLPENCVVHFGDYQIHVHKEGGQSEDYFEIQFQLSKTSLLHERNLSFSLPVPEQGLACTDSPIETDENEWERAQKKDAE